MKLVSFLQNGQSRLGALKPGSDDQIIDLNRADSSLPDNIIEDAGTSAGSTFMNNQEVTHSYRRLQFGLRIVF